MNTEFVITKDKSRLPIDEVVRLLHTTYWVANRIEEQIRKAIDNSIVFVAYDVQTDKFVGIARVITDYATSYYICDVVVDDAYRGNGIGGKLVETVVSDDALASLRGILMTRDAHGLYERYGFKREPERAMTTK